MSATIPAVAVELNPDSISATGDFPIGAWVRLDSANWDDLLGDVGWTFFPHPVHGLGVWGQITSITDKIFIEARHLGMDGTVRPSIVQMAVPPQELFSVGAFLIWQRPGAPA